MMDTQVWTQVEEKWANLLTLRGHEVTQLKVTGNVLTLKRNLKKVQEALAAGSEPAESGAKLVGTVDARSIAKAELSPGNGSLKLYGPGDKPDTVRFSPGDNSADQILSSILKDTGRTFQPVHEEVSIVEALLAPGILGGIGGVLWFALYDSAQKRAVGEEVEIRGRRQGMKQLLVNLSEMVGPKGALTLGVAFFLLMAFWVFHRITKRPIRTVLKPDGA